MCAGYRKIPNKKFRHGLGFGPIVYPFDPTRFLSAMMLPLPTYPISNKNKLPTMFSIGFVSVWFWMCLNDCASIIFEEIPCKNSSTCFFMCLGNAVLDHLPISMIEKIGTLERYMAIAAPKRIDLVPISDWWMPSFVSPIATTLLRHKLTIISAMTLMIVFLCFTRETREFLFVPLYNRFLLVIDAQIFTRAQKLVSFPQLSDGNSLSVIFLSFKHNRNVVCQMKRCRAIVKGFAVSDEGNIPKAQLLCLPLLRFWNICILARAHRPEVDSSCKLSHCLAKFCGF
jgi:hypothetical protein